MENSCIFCRIVNGELPASIVFESEEVIAIMDIRPINEGHVLVLPKAHYAKLNEAPIALSQALFGVVTEVERSLWQVEGLVCEGTNILQNNGRSAWQEVEHVHFHIIPRFAGDGFKIKYEAKRPSRADLEEMAKRIHAGLDKS